MSDDDDDDDLFGGGSDSDDTNDLIQSSKSAKAAAPPPKRLKKAAAAAAPAKKKAAAAKKKKTKSNDDEGGLFDDSDDDDDDDDDSEKKSNKKPAAAAAPKKATLSKKERMEALAQRRAAATSSSSLSEPRAPSNKKTPSNQAAAAAKKNDGYDSDDSIDSAQIQRTAEDDAFIDTTGEDADAVQELYAEQRFDDEEASEDGYSSKKKKNKKRRYEGGGGGDDDVGNAELEPDNPIMAAVHRMKKKKKEKRSFSEMEDEAKLLLGKMEQAADEDDAKIAQREPATHKLSLLNEVCDMLTRKDMQRMLLDLDVLAICKRWIQPLPNGTLGNVTVRQRLLHAVSNMNGENGINANDLKRSEFGKVVMVLYKHKAETPAMKHQLKQLIEQWSRPIFQKSGNMRDLERVQASRGTQGLAALSRQQQQQAAHLQPLSAQKKGFSSSGDQEDVDLQSLIALGKKGGPEGGVNRVRVPFSKGFAFSVRPHAKASASAGTVTDKRRVAVGASAASSGTADTRGKLAKRILEKGRAVSKNQRSANISIEGRPTK